MPAAKRNRTAIDAAGCAIFSKCGLTSADCPLRSVYELAGRVVTVGADFVAAGDVQTAFVSVGQNDVDMLERKELLAVQKCDARARDVLDEYPMAFLLAGHRRQTWPANQSAFGAAIKTGKAPLLVKLSRQRAGLVEEIVPVLGQPNGAGQPADQFLDIRLFRHRTASPSKFVPAFCCK